MKISILVVAGIFVASLTTMSAVAQQQGQTPTLEQYQDLAVQLNITQQQLANSNAEFASERTKALKLNQQIGVLQTQLTDAATKLKTAQAAAATKPEAKPADPATSAPVAPEAPKPLPAPVTTP